MNEHPVPRNITGFQFQLIGFMTLKQFGYLLFGVVVAFVFFRLPIGIFRFPVAALVAFIGIAFAFFPIQERPLDVWFTNLLKTMYNPTQYLWKKESTIPEYLTKEIHARQPTSVKQRLDHTETRAKLTAYLASVSEKTPRTIDTMQDESLEKINQLFGLPIHTQSAPVSPLPTQNMVSRIFTHQAKQPAPTPHTTSPLKHGTIAGFVKTKQGILPGALVNIQNEKGEQVRLLKTTNEGAFALSIPLEEGTYTLMVEDPKRAHQFRPINFSVGKDELHPWLIQPIETTT